MREKTQDYSKLSCEDHIYSDMYDQFLCNFQEDIRKIIGKHRKPFNALSPDDLFSESNLYLIKYKKKILSTFDENTPLTENEFKKIAYHYVKNCINWSHYREYNEKHNLNKVDEIHNTDDGVKTTFEMVIETQGKEDEPKDNPHDLNLKRFMHVLLKYSYLLTENETKILSYIEKGLNQDEIAEKLQVTRQAVSFSFIKMKEKLATQFNFENILNNDISNDVPKGLDAINRLLKPVYQKLTEEDKLKIKDFLLKNPAKKYTFQDINRILFDSKYLGKQISGCVRFFKLQYLVAKRKEVFDFHLKEKITNFFKEGLSSKEISKKIHVSERSIASFRGSLVSKGILTRSSRPQAYPDDASTLVISLNKKGISNKDIQLELKKLNPNYCYSIRSIAARINAFKRSNPF